MPSPVVPKSKLEKRELMQDSEQERPLWQECLSNASDLEAFDPRLTGIVTLLSSLQTGQPISQDRISQFAPYLKNDAVAAVALLLNEIAGLRYAAQDFNSAMTLCQAALTLHSAAAGHDDPASLTIAANLDKLAATKSSVNPAKLPKLKDFQRKRKQ